MDQDRPLSGLYVGFEGYRSPTEADLVQAIRESLVVLDTNVLLHLYNYQGSSLDDFIRVFEALTDRLFVPHQVLDEFWRNRRAVLAESHGRNREQENVQKAFDDLESAFRRWHQRVVDRTIPPPRDVVRELEEAREAVLNYMVRKNSEATATLPDTPTHDDRVLEKLEPILLHRVGPAPTSSSLDDMLVKGKSRIARKTPPGYMDAEKNPERAIGDFLVWHQTMEAAKERKRAVLFVTQDQKEDWWADRGTRSMRARPELVSELLTFSGQQLLMIRAHDLVRLGSYLGVEVRESTLAEAELTSEEVAGWTLELVSAYLDVLAAWPDHLQILNEAAQHDGEISRAKLAKIRGLKTNAAMTGVARPYSTALRRLTEQSELAIQLDVPIAAYYETGGWMSHLVMPNDLVSLFKAGFAEYQIQNDA